MSLYKELSYHKNEIDKVKGIQFCILSPEEIIKRSVCEVKTTELFNMNEPAQDGLFDSRMGVLEHNQICNTCEQNHTFCPGHFGHIVLAKPVFYPHFFIFIRKLLNCVCFRCSKLLIDVNNPAILNKKISRQKRFELMYKVCSKVLRCGAKTTDGCGAKQPDKIFNDKDGVFRIVMEWKNLQETPDEAASLKQVMNAEDVLRIFNRITDADCKALGFCPKFNRPEWMICTVLPVPPPSVRPSVRNDAGQRSEDDLTHKLTSIIKTNQALRARIEKNASMDQYDTVTQLLQYDVATLVNNKIPSLPMSLQRTGRPIKSLSERLQGKEGRIRGNLMGKRVDFSARSVITPDPNISIEELGVPLKIAMNLTFPEIVNDITIEELQKLVKAGPHLYPGAKYVIKTAEDSRKIRLQNVNREQIAANLEHGDIVERHLRDGDYVMFNRQPSLHKMSMMAHKIKVMPYDTFRLNVCVTPCFNADFDGDEMNVYVPQSLQTQQELIMLAAVPQQIISPRESAPIVSIVQDIALGVYRLTKSHVKLHEKQLFNILAPIIEGIKPIPKAHFAQGSAMQRWSGRQLLSTIIPPNISIHSANKFFDERKEDDSDNYVIIENGEIKQGTLDKSIYQARSKGLVHSIYNEYSADETRRFFDNTQQLICNWLVYSGFSTGISDMVVEQETLGKCDDIIKQMKVEVNEFITKVHKGEFDNKSTKNNADYFEQEVNNLLNRATKRVGDLTASQVDDKVNRMINMIKSGAKGSEINFAQMIGCLGQQNVDGARIPYGFDDRTLPHFTKFDDGAEARGFVQNSFIGGLTPQEFFFHAMGGREGLIDTAIKSVTGNTPIIIIEDKVPHYVNIGDWIDMRFELDKTMVEHFPNDRNLEMLNIQSDVYIPTVDANGYVTWGQITAMTRHDPGDVLYRVLTKSGRTVTVTAGQSLLVWKTDSICEVLSSEIQVGDRLPVTLKLPQIPEWKTFENKQGVFDGALFAHRGLNCTNCTLKLYLAIGACQEYVQGFVDSVLANIGEKEMLCCPTSKVAELLVNVFSRAGIFAELKPIDCVFRGVLVNNTHDYDIFNNVVLDPVVSIEPLVNHGETKMYDLTIPSTFNFGLANGLQVRDTSSTGYIQRQLVKAMEDCKVHQDFTVRNANGSIIQFLYGEDGMDAAKIEAQGLPFVDMTLDQMAQEFLVREKSAFKSVLLPEIYDSINEDQMIASFAKHFDQVVQDRHYLSNVVNKSGNSGAVSYPVNIQRMINTYSKYDTNMLLDLSPTYIIDVVDRLCKKLFVTKVAGVSKLFQMLIRCHLSPKKVLTKYRLCKATFDILIQQITQRFYDSIAHPGDIVGVVAAQSIGEPTMQLSVTSSTRILVQNKHGYFYDGPIGPFIDRLLAKNLQKIVNLGEDSVVMDLNGDYKIIGVSDEEKTSWKPISQVSRHPANGGMVRIYTKSGKTTCATLSHSFLKRTVNGIDPVLGSDLNIGDRVPVAKYIPTVEGAKKTVMIGDYEYKLTFDLGWLCGTYLTDGSINSTSEYENNLRRILSHDNMNFASFLKEEFKTGSFNKRIPNWVYGSHIDFICGVIAGWMDSDGEVVNVLKGKQMINCQSVSNDLIDDMILMFAFVGIFAIKCHENQNIFSIQISRKYASLYRDVIGFIVKDKKEALDDLINYVQSDDKEEIDMIPELGMVIAQVCKTLELEGCFAKKDVISRDTLDKYISVLQRGYETRCDEMYIFEKEVRTKLAFMRQVHASSKTEFIDFTETITKDTLFKYIQNLDNSFSNVLKTKCVALSNVPPCLEVLQQALNSDVVWDEIVHLEYLDDPKEYVYDFTVPGNDSFMVDNGVLVHNTLNSFHSAGISSASKAVRGVPRLQELLSVTKKIKTPIMTIHVKPEYRTMVKSKEEYKVKCLDVLNEITTTRFRDIATNSRIYYDPDDFNTRIPEDKSFIDMYKMFNLSKDDGMSPWLLRLEFNRQMMVNLGVTMIDLQNVLADFYDDRVACMFSDDNAGDLVMRIKLTTMDETMLSEIKALEYDILEKVIINGIHGIEKVSMREQKSQYFGYQHETQTFEEVTEWIMDTAGSNLQSIMSNKHVNPYLTTTNNIYEIYEVLGIEAARQALHNEIMDVLSGINVNYRHISLLLDTMTNKGVIMPINRHGINRGDTGPMAKCSFEEVTDMLVSAGVFAETDMVNGVSANVMLGQIAQCGTGDSDILLDENAMTNILEARKNTNDKRVHPQKVQISMILPKPIEVAKSFPSKKMNILFT